MNHAGVRDRRTVWAVVWLMTALGQGLAAGTFYELDPAGRYRVRVEQGQQALRLVWSRQDNNEDVYELGAALGYYDGKVCCHAVGADGRVWLAIYGPAGRNVGFLMIVPSPVAAQSVDVGPDAYYGLDGAERLRQNLQQLGRLRTPDGAFLIGPTVLQGLARPEFETGPGPDVNFPRPQAEREAAANKLREVGLAILNQSLAAFAEHYCLYELTDGNRFSFGTTRLSVQTRNSLQALQPFPPPGADLATVQAWRANRWRVLPLAERQRLNRLLLACLLPLQATGRVPLELPVPCEQGFLSFARDPFDSTGQRSVISLYENSYSPPSRLAVVETTGRVLWQDFVPPQPMDPSWLAWCAVLAGEQRLARIPGLSQYEADQSAGWLRTPGTTEGRQRWLAPVYREVGLLPANDYRGDNFDLASVTSAELRRLGPEALIGWFELPEGDVFLLPSGRLAICPGRGRATTMADHDVLLDVLACQAQRALDRSLYPPLAPLSARPVAAPAPFIPAIRTARNPKDGHEMIYIPAGEFLMGSSLAGRLSMLTPMRRIHLDGFWIYKEAVTSAEFDAFVRRPGQAFAPSLSLGRPTAPAWVFQNGAAAYAAWAGGQFPTSAQMEKATRGTDGRFFAPEDDFRAEFAVTPYGLVFRYRSPTPASSEWTSDHWGGVPPATWLAAPDRNPVGSPRQGGNDEREGFRCVIPGE